MRWITGAVLVVHGLLHFIGPVKAFGLAPLPALTQPISRGMGIVWLLAGMLTLAAAIAIVAWPRVGWALGLVALVLSQIAISSAWSDARFGTLGNVVLLGATLYALAMAGPWSPSQRFAEAIARHVRAPGIETITDADLAPLPVPVRRYLRATGFVGQPRVEGYRVRFRGRIRSDADSAWMPFEAEQRSFVHPAARLFLMHATMHGVPIEALHLLENGRATMRVSALGAFAIVDARGPEMDRSETVTLFNDMCILAPGTLVDPAIRWTAVDDHHARASFTNGASTIEATLVFDDEGLLVDFVSDDRSRSSSDGASFTRHRFTTPVGRYRAFGPVRLASHGAAVWHLPDGDLTYAELDVLDVSYESP